MRSPLGGIQSKLPLLKRVFCAVFLLFNVNACALVQMPEDDEKRRLGDTVDLVAEVKEFGKILGIEPTEALSQSARERPSLSMLWLWMQRLGTLALRAPIDVRMAIGFGAAKEQVPLEQVYKVDGYSVYYRQGNEFADQRSVATVGFAEEGIVRRVKVIFHEDLHGDRNFNLPWEIEESIVTPLGSLAAIEFFRHKADKESLKQALDSMAEERRLSRELSDLVKEAERLFGAEALEGAKKKILALIPSFPAYHRQFERQIAGQNPDTALEAKLSHDLVYYRYYDRIVSLYERSSDLGALINDLKKLPRDIRLETVEQHLEALDAHYAGAPR